MASFGFTNAVVFLHIGKPIRRLVSGSTDKEWFESEKMGFRSGFLGRWIHCHACFGFFSGVLLWLVFDFSYMCTVGGLSSSFFCFFVWCLLKDKAKSL